MTDERVLVLNGPSLNLLGRREPGVYGSETLDDVRVGLEALAKELGCSVEMRQSNHEGQLVDWIHEVWDIADGIVINPGHSPLLLRARRWPPRCAERSPGVLDLPATGSRDQRRGQGRRTATRAANARTVPASGHSSRPCR
jgi:hypothetical protein